MSAGKTVTAEYLAGIRDGREWLKRYGMEDAQASRRMKYHCLFSAARNVEAPNYYPTDRFSGTVTVEAENEQQARHRAIDEVYRIHAAENVGHVIIKRTDGEGPSE